ncbi:hypothetical protein cand_035200 [Cryptosporidium andersoni]|uniref:Nas2 N-terminal domain-containing protein n=1 Tax=Cryptosporidium andersoni TaxID=117008 RepID=A0A1J4MVU4_9CRYT|nr:hypothetical protein cand_035200 [Cryptosporidium andersoni]
MDELIKQKENIEKEVKELTEFLNSFGPDVGIKGSLVDSEGFPRADIDLYEIRSARNRLAILNTDYSEVMKKIETKLIELHSQSKINVPYTVKKQSCQDVGELIPFARVDDVKEASPAYESGLRVGDLILKFGSLYVKEGSTEQQISTIFEDIPTKVVESLSKILHITVSRPKNSSDLIKEVINIEVTPKKWSGSGYLGCHIVAHKNLNSNL